MATILYNRSKFRPTWTVETTEHIGQGLFSRQFAGKFEVYPRYSRVPEYANLHRFRALKLWMEMCEENDKDEVDISRVRVLHAQFNLAVSTFLDWYGGAHIHHHGGTHPPFGLEPLPVRIPYNSFAQHPLNILLDPQAYVVCSDIRDAYAKATLEELAVLPADYSKYPEHGSDEDKARFQAPIDEQQALMGFISSTICPFLDSRNMVRDANKTKGPPLSSPHDDTMEEMWQLTMKENGAVAHNPVPYVTFLSEVKTIARLNGAKTRNYDYEPLPMGRPRKNAQELSLKDKIRSLFLQVREHGITKSNAQDRYNVAARLWQQANAVLTKWNTKREKEGKEKVKPVNKSMAAHQYRDLMKLNNTEEIT